jgi:hypothetical protein
MLQHVPIQRVEREIVNVGGEDAFAEIIEDDDSRQFAQPRSLPESGTETFVEYGSGFAM